MVRALALALALTLGLTPLTARAADQAPYDINVVVSQTGPAAFIGASVSKMLGILETVVNKQGGIKGRPIKFLINDDTSTPLTAVQFVTKLQSSNVPVILGPAFVVTCAASMPLTVKNGPLTWCFAPGITPPAGSYVFSTGATIDDAMLVVIRYSRERNWKRIAVISTTDASGQSFDRGVAFAMAQPEMKDVTLVAHEHFNSADLSATAQMVRVKNAKSAGVKPDLGYNLAWDPTMLLVDALRKLGPDATALQLRDYILSLHGWAGINGVYDFSDGRPRPDASRLAGA